MRQDAVVVKKYNNGIAEVAVTRGTACGSNCSNCEACIYASELHTNAVNKINAGVGQHVILESKNSKIYKAEFIVYVLPMILMLLSYIVAYSLNASEGVCVLSCFIALAVSAAVLVLTQRNKKGIQHIIIAFKGE